METNKIDDVYTPLNGGASSEVGHSGGYVKEGTSDFKTTFSDGEPKKIAFGQYGWICPVCGRGCSPYTMVCPCCHNGGGYNEPWKVTCENEHSNVTCSVNDGASWNNPTTTYTVSGNAANFENPLYS